MFQNLPRLRFILIPWILTVPSLLHGQNTSVHTTWLWHLHQPIYWPNERSYSDHYENAWDTIQAQDAGRSEPNESLTTVFDDADRVAAYQGELQGVLSSIGNIPDSGAQVNMSGALMENVQSLAAAGQLGYYTGWNDANATARTWSTTGGHPRMDLVNFTYHHAMAPLISDATLKMELQIHQRQMQIFWGTNPSTNQPGPALSRGYFPAETCFSERMIPILNSMGIAWTVIANNHLVRACPDMPLNLGSGGEMCDIPNPADQLNPAQGTSNYQTLSIDRGCSPTAAMPFSYQVHTARYVDPATGTATTIMVVPSDQAMSWKDSYSSWDLGLIAPLASRNSASKPALVLLAHDGDNAWSGGYSYYNQWVQQMASTAVSDGYAPTTIEQFLADFPPDPADIVHVEDGGWVFADSDFGSPSYINWNWPPSYTGTNGVNVVDPSVGVSTKADFWRTVIATENRVRTAQQITGITPRTDQVRDPGSYSTTPNSVELAWHYYLAGLDSGFLYYGVADQLQRCAVAQSNVVREIDSTVNANLAQDATPPTVFLPQRHPWNPGAANYGVQYGYQKYTPPNTDFWIWTYAYDASGMGSVTLYYRSNGNSNPPTKDEFKTYAGGPDTGAWQTISMTKRVVANQLELVPQYYADYYYTKISGMSDTYIDYYVSASDTKGNTYNSPIQHVYVAVNQNPTVPAVPANLTATAVSSTQINLTWSPSNGAASYSVLRGGSQVGVTGSNGYSDTGLAPSTTYTYAVVASNSAGSSQSSLSATATTQAPPLPPATPSGLTATAASDRQINLAWNSVAGATSYVIKQNGTIIATTGSTAYIDYGLASQTAYNFTVAAVNTSGTSTDSSSASATTQVTPPGFILNGVAPAGYLVANSGMTIYAAVRGTLLFVATWTPTGGVNDHFIFVSNALLSGTTAPAPWAKAGTLAVASTQPYLAAESTDSYIGWYNAPASSQVFRSGTAGEQMEGVIDLAAAFGSVPSVLYIAVGAYQTFDGGVLAAQAPAGNGDGNIDANEFLQVTPDSIRDSAASGIFDRLDPARKFCVDSVNQAVGGGFTISWKPVPGHIYAVDYLDSLGSGMWAPLPGATSITATSGVGDLSVTDSSASGMPQRFYRVRIVQ